MCGDRSGVGYRGWIVVVRGEAPSTARSNPRWPSDGGHRAASLVLQARAVCKLSYSGCVLNFAACDAGSERGWLAGDKMAAIAAVSCASASKLATNGRCEGEDGCKATKKKVQGGSSSLGGLMIRGGGGGGLRWSGGKPSSSAAPKNRRISHIVAASPPKKEDGIRSGEPLTRQDLVAYLASGCKPKERWRCVGSVDVGLVLQCSSGFSVILEGICFLDGGGSWN